MRILTPIWRTLRLSEHLLTGATIAAVLSPPSRLGLIQGLPPRLVSWWHRRLCRALGIRVQTHGGLAPNALLVANHVSWIDIPVIGSQGPVGFLSKAEVRQWPLVGWMAAAAGTLFMTRGANQAGEMVRLIEARLRAGRCVGVFPEGTTSDGSRLLRFHPRLLAAGQCEGVPVQPVALRFGTNQTPDSIAPFIGDDDLVSHLARLVRHPGLWAELHLLPPFDANGLSRRQIAERCRSAIAAALEIEPPAAGSPEPVADDAQAFDPSTAPVPQPT